MKKAKKGVVIVIAFVIACSSYFGIDFLADRFFDYPCLTSPLETSPEVWIKAVNLPVDERVRLAYNFPGWEKYYEDDVMWLTSKEEVLSFIKNDAGVICLPKIYGGTFYLVYITEWPYKPHSNRYAFRERVTTEEGAVSAGRDACYFDENRQLFVDARSHWFFTGKIGGNILRLIAGVISIAISVLIVKGLKKLFGANSVDRASSRISY